MGILAVPAMIAATVSAKIATKRFSVGAQVVAKYDDRAEVVDKDLMDLNRDPTDFRFSGGSMLGVVVEVKIKGTDLIDGKYKVCWCRDQDEDIRRTRGIESDWIEIKGDTQPIEAPPDSFKRKCTRLPDGCTEDNDKCILGPSPPCTTTTPRPPPPPVAPKASIPDPSPTTSGPPSSLSPAQIRGIILIIAGTAIIGILSAALLSRWRSGTTPRGRRARPSSRSR